MRRYKKTRYRVISFFEELIIFFISYFLNFPSHVKRIILCFVYSDDHKHSFVYPSLEEDPSSSSIVDLDPIFLVEPYEKNDVHIPIFPEHDQPSQLVDSKLDLPLEITIVSFNQPCIQLSKVQSKIREHYKPLKLPLILHEYPPNFLDYLLSLMEKTM